MSEIYMNIAPDEELLKKAQLKLSRLGIDITTYFNNMLQKIVEEDITELSDIPKLKKDNFLRIGDLSEEERERRMNIINSKGNLSEAFGVLEDLVWMSDDFDEPLECMKEYME